MSGWTGRGSQEFIKCCPPSLPHLPSCFISTGKNAIKNNSIQTFITGLNFNTMFDISKTELITFSLNIFSTLILIMWFIPCLYDSVSGGTSDNVIHSMFVWLCVWWPLMYTRAPTTISGVLISVPGPNGQWQWQPLILAFVSWKPGPFFLSRNDKKS